MYLTMKKWKINFYISFVFICSWCHQYAILGARIQDLVILDELLKNSYDRRATPTNHLNNTTPARVFCEIFVRSFGGGPNPLTMTFCEDTDTIFPPFVALPAQTILEQGDGTVNYSAPPGGSVPAQVEHVADYTVDLYLRQMWRDERLEHSDLKEPLDLNDPNLVKAIWKPEVYFPNAKEADFQFVTVPNVLVRIHPGGEILYMLRLRVTFSCMMNLSKFPLDRQTCTMEVASFSKTMDELILEWVKESPITTGNGGMSQFEIDGITAEKCHESFGQIGNYSCLVAAFHLTRSIGFHLVQSYLPTILMVVISWVSFWMDVSSVPGRVTLGVTTLLTVSSKSTNIQENLPQASYVKAIDVWMGTCTGFVFLALLEFIVVNFMYRKEYQEELISSKSNSFQVSAGREIEESTDVGDQIKGNEPSENDLHSRFVHSSSSNQGLTGTECPTIFHTQESQRIYPGKQTTIPKSPKTKSSIVSARVIDETCRFAFPFAFFVFNCIYWPYYLYYP